MNCGEKVSEKGQEKAGGFTKSSEQTSKKGPAKEDSKLAKSNEKKSKNELGKTGRKAAKNNYNSKHCKNLYVGSVGVSLQRVACSLPILLCWFKILALQNLYKPSPNMR